MSNMYYTGKSRVSDPIHFQAGVQQACGRDWGWGLTQLTSIFTRSKDLGRGSSVPRPSLPSSDTSEGVLLRGWGVELCVRVFWYVSGGMVGFFLLVGMCVAVLLSISLSDTPKVTRIQVVITSLCDGIHGGTGRL